MAIEGAQGVALVDWDSGFSLGDLGGGELLDLALCRRATPRSSGPRS